MVVGKEKERNNENGRVKFISYDGKYPTLCSGELILEIDGEVVVFGHHNIARDKETKKYIDGHYDSFWSSGGDCGFSSDYSDTWCSTGEWNISFENLPEQFRKYADEIDEVFNDNVEYGCCGGCL